jgi:hypothetical protein
VDSCILLGESQWYFQGAAAHTMQTLRELGWGLLPPVPLEPSGEHK